jgi:hypothetical protein
MSQVGWNANSRGEYWIDVSLGGHSLSVLIDTGLIDARGQVGFSIDPAQYDKIKCAGGFRVHQMHTRLTADGQISLTESGSLDAQMLSRQTMQVVGPAVHVHVFRGSVGVPDRVGLAFFHPLKGCRVFWDLDQRLWIVEYP